MSEPLERWGEDAPEPFRAAKAAYGQLGPDSEQLERMLGQVEQAAALSTAAGPARLWSASKAWYWLLPVLPVLGAAWLWIFASKPEPAAVAPKRAAIERAGPASSDMRAVPEPLPGAAKKRAEHDAPPEPAAATASRSSPRARARRTSDPLAELALLDRARRVMGKDPARALALAEQHARDYETGQFAEERELLAIEALVRLERQAAAQRRARVFRRVRPNSVHAHRLGVILSPAPR